MLSFVRPIIKFLLPAFFAVAGWSQQTTFTITHYDETTGLESNVIKAMLQDSRGYLWFGTADGLCRYDGYNFKTFRKIKGEANSLPGNFILKLAEDREGKIWIGLLKDGISCYDPATGIFRNYDVKNLDPAAPLARSITMLATDKENNIWAGLYQKGLLKLDKTTGKFTRYNIIDDTHTFYSKEFSGPYNNVYDIYEQSKNIYWLATHDGLYKFNAVTAQMLAVRSEPLPEHWLRDSNTIRNDLFNTIVADKNGLWLSSWAGGLSHYDFTTQQWGNYKFSQRNRNIATSNLILDIKPKNENELWIASLDKGFGTFNKTTLQFRFLSDSNTVNPEIPAAACSAIMLDKQNNIWLVYADGLYKIKQTEKKFLHIPLQVSRSDNGPFYGINCMLEDKKGAYLFAGTSYADGLHIINKHTGKTQTISFATMPNEESALIVSDLIEDSRGIIWLLTRDYLYQYDPQRQKLIDVPQPPIYRNDIPSNDFTVLREDQKGQLWIATARNGIFCYHPSEGKYQHFNSDPASKKSLPSNVITGLAIDCKGRVWVGSTRGCFGYFENSSHQFVNLDQYGKQSQYNSDNRVYTLYADKHGDIWAGTDAGLYYYNVHDVQPDLKKVYNADNGLRGDLVTSIQEDTKGDIWCVTGSALCKINRQTGNIVAFRKQDGIDKINLLNGLFLFQTGRMAAFTVKGYYEFDPSSLLKKNILIPAAITSFKVDNKEYFFENNIRKNKKSIVPATANVISFEFAALDFDRPDKQQYAYMLEGFDKSWVMAGQRRYAGYANIPRGDYVFKVKATNTPDNWEVPIASIPIHVEQLFYKSWWFIGAIIISIAASGYMFYRFKLIKQQQIHLLGTKAQLLEKEKALVMYESLKQQLNPHFLFNSLTSLSSLIQYNQQKAGEFLEGLSKLYRYILKNRDNETVALTEEIKFVQTFIHLQQTRFEHGLMVTINIPPAFGHCKIAPVTLQNLIENAIKHNIIDEESPLKIEMYTEGGYIVIRNNLQKKNFVETSNKQGLANLISLYRYLSDKPVIITERDGYFSIKIPML